MSKKNKLFSLTVLASMLAMTGCGPTNPNNSSDSSTQSVVNAVPLDVEFFDKTVVYDGKPHAIEITGTLPEGVTVSYDVGAVVQVGDYKVTASFSDGKGTLYQSKQATLHIVDPLDSSNIWKNLKFQGNKTKFVYDGKAHSLMVDPNTIPDGYDVSRYEGQNNETNVGSYIVTVYIKDKKTNLEVYQYSTVMEIIKADFDMSNVSFESREFAYETDDDGNPITHSLVLEGLDENAPITYSLSNHTRSELGSQTATAIFKSTNPNYNDPQPMTAVIDVKDASEMVAVEVYASYLGTNALVYNRETDSAVDTSVSPYTIYLPIGGTLKKSDLPPLIPDRNNRDKVAPNGAYDVEFSADSVTNVKQSTLPIVLSVIYSPIRYSITYEYKDSSKGVGIEKVTYTYDEQIDISAPSMNDGFIFDGWTWKTDYKDAFDSLFSHDIYYQNKSQDISDAFAKGSITVTDNKIPQRTCVGNLHLTVRSQSQSPDIQIKDEVRSYTGLEQNVDIFGANASDLGLIKELKYEKEDGTPINGAPKDVGTYRAILNVYKDSSKTEKALAEQVSILTITRASVHSFKDENTPIIGGSLPADDIFRDPNGDEIKALFTAAAGVNNLVYNQQMNQFVTSYDGTSKEVAVKVWRFNRGQIPSSQSGFTVLRSNAVSDDFPFVPHISYKNLETSVESNNAPTDAGEYEVIVSFSEKDASSKNFETIKSIKSRMVIKKSTVDDLLQDVNHFNKWEASDGSSVNPSLPTAVAFRYEENKIYSLKYVGVDLANFPEGVTIDHYSGEKSASSGNFKATVYFKNTNKNIEDPKPISINYVVSSNSCIVIFKESKDLVEMQRYSIEAGSVVPIPTRIGDDLTYTGYDKVFYLLEDWEAGNRDEAAINRAKAQLSAITPPTTTDGTTPQVTFVIHKVPHDYSIKYVINSQADNSMNLSTYNIESADTLKEPTLSGAVFLGWYTDSDFKSTKVNIGTKYIDIYGSDKLQNIVLYAKFSTQNPTIYFKASEDSDDQIAAIDVVVGEKYLFPETKPTRQGYTFLYWYIVNQASEKVMIDESTIVTTAMTHNVYAMWEASVYQITANFKEGDVDGVSPKFTWVDRSITFNVSYDSAFSTASNADALYHSLSELISAISEKAKKMGYSFDGFYYIIGGNKVELTDVFNYSSNQVIEARYVADEIKVNYYFVKMNNQITGMDHPINDFSKQLIANKVSINSKTDQVISLPSVDQLSKDGYSLKNFYRLNSINSVLDTASINSSVEIFTTSFLTPYLRNSLIANTVGDAKTEIDIAIIYASQKYTVTFLDKDGERIYNNGVPYLVEVGYKETFNFTAPATLPEKYKGYEYDGWIYTDENGSQTIFDGNMAFEFSKDISVVLRLKEKACTIEYYQWDEEKYDVLNGKYKGSIGNGFPSAALYPNRDGYDFVGWVRDRDYIAASKTNLAYKSKRDAATHLVVNTDYAYQGKIITSADYIQVDDIDANGIIILHAVWVEKTYSVQIEYKSNADDGREVTSILYLDTYLTSDPYLYYNDNGTGKKLSYVDGDGLYKIPERTGYSINSLISGTNTIFDGTLTSSNAFTLNGARTTGSDIVVDSTVENYGPNGGKVTWSNPMVLTVSYSALTINANFYGYNIIQSKSADSGTVVEENAFVKIPGSDTYTDTEQLVMVKRDRFVNQKVLQKLNSAAIKQTYGNNMIILNDPTLDGSTFKKWVRTTQPSLIAGTTNYNPGEILYQKTSAGNYVEATINRDSKVDFTTLYTKNADVYTPYDVKNQDIYIMAVYTENPLVFTFSGSGSSGERFSLLRELPFNATEDVKNFFADPDSKGGYRVSTDVSNNVIFEFCSSATTIERKILPAIENVNGYKTGQWKVTISYKALYVKPENDYYVLDGNTRNKTKTVSLTELKDIIANDPSYTNISASIVREPKDVTIYYLDSSGNYTNPLSVVKTAFGTSFVLQSAEEKEGMDFVGWKVIQGKGYTTVDKGNPTDPTGFDETDTIIKSGNLTLDKFNYITIDKSAGDLNYDSQYYYVYFKAVYEQKSYKIKFNIGNGDISSDGYIKDAVQEYNFTIKNGQKFEDIMLGNKDKGIESIQLKLLNKLGLSPDRFAIVLQSQKGDLPDVYAFSIGRDGQTNYYLIDSNGAVKSSSSNIYYDYAKHGNVFNVGILYRTEADPANDIFTFSDSAASGNDRTALESFRGAKLRDLFDSGTYNDANLYKTNLWIPSYYFDGNWNGTDNIKQVVKLLNGSIFSANNGIEALYYNTNYSLKSITIPSNIKTIDSNVFANPNGDPITNEFTSLTKINYLGTAENWLSIDFLSKNSNPMALVSKVSDGGGGYKNNYYTKDAYGKENQTLRLTMSDNYDDNIILTNSTVSTIKKYAFINLSYLKKIQIANTYTTFEEDCFRIYDDRDLLSGPGTIKLERWNSNASKISGLTDGTYFIRKNNLEEVDYIGSIGEWANITFKSKYSNPMSLSKFVNDNRANLTECKLNINGNLLRSLDATSLGLSSVKDYSFYGVSSLVTVTLSDATASIGKYAFARTGLSSISLPTAVTTIDEGAFAYCPNLVDVQISTNVSEFKVNTFIKYQIAGNIKNVTINYTGILDDFKKNIVKSDDNNKVNDKWYGYLLEEEAKPSGEGSITALDFTQFRLITSDYPSPRELGNILYDAPKDLAERNKQYFIDCFNERQ